MRNLEIDSQTTLAHILNELKTTEEDGLEITVVPGEKSILDNPLNRKIIEKVASGHKKEVVFPAVPIEQAPEAEADDLGFVEGEDVVAKAPIEEVHKMIQPETAAPAIVNKTSNKGLATFNKILKNKFAWLGVGVLILLAILWLGLFFLPSAQVTITAKTQDKDTQLTLTADKAAKEASVKDKVVPYETTQVSKEGSDEQATTGKKTIGTLSKGRVTVTNQDTTGGKTFSAGTILTPTSNANVTFKLDSDVVLEQAPIGGEKTAGVNITAVKAGPEGNLAEGTVFKVGNSPEYLVFARNDVALSGGSSKLANVASAEDRENLKNQIIEKLEEEAKEEIEQKNKEVIVVEDSFEVKITKESYDPKNVDAETENLKATIGITATAAIVDNGELKKLVVETLDSGSEGFEVEEDNLEITLQQTGKEGDKLTLLAKVAAELVPELKEEELKRNLVGKSVAQAGEYLDSLEEVASYKVTSSPFYFRFLGRLPFSQDKIRINFEN